MPFQSLQDEQEGALGRFVEDFHRAGETSKIPALFRHPDWSHRQFVEILGGWSRGEDLAPPESRLFKGFVPSTTRFLTTDDRAEILGVVNVRHRLNEVLERFGGHIGYSVRPSERRRGHATQLLQEGLRMARTLGHDRVMLTCQPDNIGSNRTILRCGGELHETFFHPDFEVDVNLYWITLVPPS